jgi:hypothetical protein
MTNWGAGIAQWYSAGLRAGWSVVRMPVGAGNFSPHHRVQNGSGAHPASYPLGVKRPGRQADHSPPSSAEVKECVELQLHSPNTPSWRGAQLKHRDTFTFTFKYVEFCWTAHKIMTADGKGENPTSLTAAVSLHSNLFSLFG